MRQGQVIVEILIAFAVAVVAIVGLAQIATKTVANAGAAKRQAQATVYAVEGMEWITGERVTSDWQMFYGRSGTYCISGLTWTSLPCGIIGTTEYSRTAVMAPAIVNLVQQVTATVTVSWIEGSRTTSVTQTAKFTPY